jgi:hypothetical protein
MVMLNEKDFLGKITQFLLQLAHGQHFDRINPGHEHPMPPANFLGTSTTVWIYHVANICQGKIPISEQRK